MSIASGLGHNAVMKVATSELKMSNGTVAYFPGDPVSDDVLDSPMAKEYGWGDLVAGPQTKAAQAAQEPAAQTPAAKGKATNAPA